uniref:Ornithine decarboxylase antizyme n=1 Tax=Emericella nidulans TaxID=162425 RepID=Q9HFU6_EMEND|nr:ornithine decarboxylase antizyme [Aspergillus nidulans]
MQRFVDKNPQSTVLASCYSVSMDLATLNGFHYCTTNGAGVQWYPEVPSGSKTANASPPLDTSLASTMGGSYPVNHSLEQKGEAAHTIPEECERLFCDALSAIFLGERLSRQELLGVDASLTQINNADGEHSRIQMWVEVLDYTTDAIYRGFVTDTNGERTLFVFLMETAVGHGLKSGLIALFELASVPAFGCSQIIACVPRSKDGSELESVRNLGWCGFSLTTLEQFGARNGNCLSNRWLFLSAEA